MSSKTKNMIPDAFESLLLEAIASDYETNVEIQKSVEMNANYVYSIPVDTVIENSVKEKISQLINKGKKTFLSYLKISIYLSLAVITGYFIYSLVSANGQANASGPDKNILPPVFTPVDTTKNIDTTIIETNDPHKLTNEIDPGTIKSHAEIIPEKKDSAGTKETHYSNISVPKPYYGSGYHEDFDPEFAKSIHPDGDDPVKIITGDYFLKACIAKLYPWDEFTEDARFIYKSNDSKQITRETLYKPVSLALYCGIPFKKGLENVSYISINTRTLNTSHDIQEKAINMLLPEGLKYYLDRSKLYKNNPVFTNDEIEKLQPFYISNTEISNLDYREFMNWVLKYNGYENIDNSPDEMEKYYDDYIYTFQNPDQEIKEKFRGNSINVFPDTDKWSTDFKYSYSQPLNDMYFWHPAYDHYPVVGVSYWQALAYLDWLTWVWQTRLDEQGIPYEIDFDLPYDFEWELACEEVLKNMAIQTNPDNIICDLNIKHYDDVEYQKAIGLKTNDYSNSYIHTSPVDAERPTSPENKSKIKNLDANVSEWLKESYSDSWGLFRKKYIDTIREKQKPGFELLISTEEYFDNTRNSKNGKLIRGANWFDNRQTDRTHFISKAMFAKCFVDPDEQHSTIGFRYVVRVRLKDQDKTLKKIEILGRNMPEINYSLINRNMEYPSNNNNDEQTKSYFQNIDGFNFIPQGSFNYKEETVSVNAFWSKETEVCNFTWMLFLNYLIDNNRTDELNRCIPNDPDWKIKMNLETDTVYLKEKYDASGNYKYLPFPKEFIKESNIEDIPITYFAFKPVTGISHEAARIFADWLTDMYGSGVDFRLPLEKEWEYMAAGGLQNVPYAWGGPYTRNYKGCFLAKFRTNIWEENKLLGDTIKTKRIDKLVYDEIVKNQNAEFTKHVSDSNWSNPNSPNLIASFTENEWGLFDVCGNAAEMICTPNKTKGGSWASGAYFIQIQNEEKWDGKPSDCVGFRLVMTYFIEP